MQLCTQEHASASSRERERLERAVKEAQAEGVAALAAATQEAQLAAQRAASEADLKLRHAVSEADLKLKEERSRWETSLREARAQSSDQQAVSDASCHVERSAHLRFFPRSR